MPTYKSIFLNFQQDYNVQSVFLNILKFLPNFLKTYFLLSVVGIQSYIGYISSRCTIEWFDIFMPYNVISPLILVINHLSPCKLTIILLTIFPFPLLPKSSSLPSVTIPLVSVSVSLFLFCFYCLFVLFLVFRFHL